MDLDRVAGLHLRYFLCVVDEGSVAAAARTLNVAQPSVSQQIAQLERRLGVRLFERSAQGMHKTVAGESLEAATRTWIGSLRSIALSQATSTIVGIPRGADPDVLHWVRNHLGGDVEFQPGTSATAPEMVQNHRLDAAIVRDCSTIDAHRLACVALPSRPLGVLASSKTARVRGFDTRSPVSLESLRGCRLLWFDEARAPGYARLLLEQLRGFGWKPSTYLFDPAGEALTLDALRNTPHLVALRPEPTGLAHGLFWGPLAVNLVERFYLVKRP